MEKAIVPAAQGMHSLVSISESVRRITASLPHWEEDALVELFRQCGVLEERSLMVRAAVVTELISRYNGGKKRISSRTWKAVAEILSEKPSTVRELHLAWTHIFSRLEPDEDLALPFRFLSQAVRARRYGIDPLEAARYASHMRNVVNRHYTLGEFRQDIQEGLPSPEEKEHRKIPCYSCPHYKLSGPGDYLLLVHIGESNGCYQVLAQNEAEEVEYCALKKVMGEAYYRERTQCKEAPPCDTGSGRKV